MTKKPDQIKPKEESTELETSLEDEVSDGSRFWELLVPILLEHRPEDACYLHQIGEV